MSEKSPTIGDFGVSRLSPIFLTINEIENINRGFIR